MATELASFHAKLRASEDPFEWEVLSESPGDVTVAWSGRTGGAGAAEKYEVRRFKVGNCGVYSLAFTNTRPPEDPAEFFAGAAKTLRNAQLAPYTSKQFAVTIEYFEITDAETVRAAHARVRQRGAGDKERDALIAYFEALMKTVDPISTEQVFMGERDRAHTDLATSHVQPISDASARVKLTYEFETGFYENHPPGVWLRLHRNISEFGRSSMSLGNFHHLAAFDHDFHEMPDPNEVYSQWGNERSLSDEIYPQWEKDQRDPSRSRGSASTDFHPLGEPQLKWRFSRDGEDDAPPLLRITRTTVERFDKSIWTAKSD